MWLFLSGDTTYKETLIKSTTEHISPKIIENIEYLFDYIYVIPKTGPELLIELNHPDISVRKSAAEQLKKLTGKDYYWEKPNPLGETRVKLRLAKNILNSIYVKIVQKELKQLAYGCEAYYIDMACYPLHIGLLTTPIAYVKGFRQTHSIQIISIIIVYLPAALIVRSILLYAVLVLMEKLALIMNYLIF